LLLEKGRDGCRQVSFRFGKFLKKQLRRGPRWKQKLGGVEELCQVSRRIARKRTIVAIVGPSLQAAVYNIKGFKHFYSQKGSSRLEPGGGIDGVHYAPGTH
jgi:hypothetical protein